MTRWRERRPPPSLRAKRSNRLPGKERVDCFVAALLAMTAEGERRQETPPPRHCERSEAIHLDAQRKNGLLRRCAPRNDGEAERRHETPLARHCERSEAIHLA